MRGSDNGTTNGPSTWWKFDENSGSTAADSSGGANPGTLTNSPTWAAAGPSGCALSFNGSSSYVAGTSRAVHTDVSLSVAAWVYLTSTAADGVAVSQNGTHTAGFTLGFDSASSKFAFQMSNSDVASPVMKIQYSRVVTSGVWYHLVGIYDPSVSRIFLYVNGVGIGNTGKTVSWDATGALQVGRAYLNDAWGSYLTGSVEDVRLYNRALSSGEITNLANGSPSLEWNFSEGSGTAAADSGPIGNTGAFGSGAGAPTWTTGHVGTGLAVANSANGYVQSAIQAVITNLSFSVSVWAYLSSSSAAGTRRVVASEAGTATSGFLLYADTSNKWSWSLPQSDVANPALDTAQSNSAAATDIWVHLVGVFDHLANSGNGSVSLYVDGAVQATTSQHTGPHRIIVTGNVQVGRALWSSAYTYPTTFTIECWFRVAGSLGGEIIGFHTNAATDVGSHDRTLYVDSGAKLTFGTYVVSAQTVRSPSTYNDAVWHYAAASLGAAGMRLYVDGSLVASSATATAGTYTGYWRWGGGTLATMPNRPTSDYLTGSVDEVAIYPTQLTDAQIKLHRQRNY